MVLFFSFVLGPKKKTKQVLSYSALKLMSEVLCSEEILVAGSVRTYVLLIAHRTRLRAETEFCRS